MGISSKRACWALTLLAVFTGCNHSGKDPSSSISAIQLTPTQSTSTPSICSGDFTTEDDTTVVSDVVLPVSDENCLAGYTFLSCEPNQPICIFVERYSSGMQFVQSFRFARNCDSDETGTGVVTDCVDGQCDGIQQLCVKYGN